MSRQAKILIFSLVLVFAIFQKQTKEPDNSYDNNDYREPTTVVPKKKPKTPVKKATPNNNLITPNFKPIATFYPQPKNGFSPYDSYFGKGVYNNNSGNSFKIKNSNTTDAVVLLVNAFSGRKVRNEYVRKNANFEMTGVPNGTYYLEWFSGENWSPDLIVGSGYKGGFQTNANFTKTRDSSDWMKVDGYQVWTVTLYSVVGGDVESEEINAEDFFN